MTTVTACANAMTVTAVWRSNNNVTTVTAVAAMTNYVAWMMRMPNSYMVPARYVLCRCLLDACYRHDGYR